MKIEYCVVIGRKEFRDMVKRRLALCTMLSIGFLTFNPLNAKATTIEESSTVSIEETQEVLNSAEVVEVQDDFSLNISDEVESDSGSSVTPEPSVPEVQEPEVTPTPPVVEEPIVNPLPEVNPNPNPETPEVIPPEQKPIESPIVETPITNPENGLADIIVPPTEQEGLGTLITEPVNEPQNNLLTDIMGVPHTDYTPIIRPTFTRVDKVYAIADVDDILYVREGKGTNFRIVGKLPKDAVCFILADAEKEWVYIESKDVRGFVFAEYLLTGDEAEEFVKSQNKEDLVYAESITPWIENKAYTYTETSVYRYVLSSTRQCVIDYALQFEGNPYVWGGTSLTEGADCSGFVQSIFANFDIELPRTSAEQSLVGKRIPIEEAQPGDLIFYQKDGSVYHVAIYMGDGMVVHASGENTGIISGTPVNYSGNAAWAVDVIGDELITDAAVDSTEYSEDALELIWALVGQECSTNYEGALAVISCVMNRADINYGGYGQSALQQLTAPGQFCYSPLIGGNWQARLNGNVADYVKEAVSDCLTEGIRNHRYLNFRSTNATGNRVNVGNGGNYYF